MTVYAKWIGDTYQITFKDQGDEDFSGDGNNYKTHTYGTATSLGTTSKTGYLFGGWYTDSACSGPRVYSVGATEITEDITLYAKWDSYSYTVRFMCNPNQSITRQPIPETVTVSSPNTTISEQGQLHMPTPAWSGFQFYGFFISELSGGVMPSWDGASIPYFLKRFSTNTIITGNITVYAIWQDCVTGHLYY